MYNATKVDEIYANNSNATPVEILEALRSAGLKTKRGGTYNLGHVRTHLKKSRLSAKTAHRNTGSVMTVSAKSGSTTRLSALDIGQFFLNNTVPFSVKEQLLRTIVAR